MESKECTKCGIDKPFDRFTKRKAGRYGLRADCKDCVNAYQNSRKVVREPEIPSYQECSVCNQNLPADSFRLVRKRLSPDCEKCRSERRRAVARRLYAENRDQVIARKRAWRENNRESERARWRAIYWRDPEAAREKNKLYREGNREYWVRHREGNRLAYNAVQAKRRAALRGSACESFSVELLAKRVEYYGSRCWICGDPYEHIDHVKPISKGGPHMLSNLRPACGPCNLSKANKWPYRPEENILCFQ